MIPSVAVLPEPTITKARGVQRRLASSWIGATRTSRPAAKGAGVVAGMVGDRYVASTTRRRTFTGVVSPETSDVTRWEEPSPRYSLPPRKVTRPDPTKRWYRTRS